MASPNEVISLSACCGEEFGRRLILVVNLSILTCQMSILWYLPTPARCAGLSRRAIIPVAL